MKALKALTGTLIAAGILTANLANAAATLYISDGVSAPVEITDVSTGNTAVSYIGSMGTWDLVFSLGTGDDGSASSTPSMEFSTTAFGLGTLDVWFVQDGFTLLPASIQSSLSSTLDPHVGTGSITQETCLFDGAASYDCSASDLNLASTVVSAPSTLASIVSETAFIGDSDTSNYSIAMHAQFVHGTKGHSSIDSNIMVPEPASLALIGLGLFGLGLARRKTQA